MEKLVIIKIGGNVIDNDAKLSAFLHDFASVNHKKILIHGGGRLATSLAEKLGIPQQMIDGRRITNEETLRIITMVYAGSVNKNIVALLQSFGCNALGVCGADGNLVLSHKRIHSDIDYGYAGDIDTVNTDLLRSLLAMNLTLVVAPVTHDQKGQLLNTNADTIAQEIANALAADYEVQLIYAFEKSGVLLDANDDGTCIASIGPSYYSQLKTEGKIFAGMIPKIDNAFEALQKGVKQVVIGKAEQMEALIANQAGTKISNE